MLLTDLQYFGTISYIQQLMQHEYISFDTIAPFSKMSFKNRTIIATAQGPLDLSIPVIGGRDQKTPLDQILIANQGPWKSQHLKAIQSSYKRAPFFEYYEESLIRLFTEEHSHLLSYLLSTQEWVKKQLKGTWKSIDIQKIDTATTHKTFQAWLPKNYHQINHPILYQQVFENKTGFMPNLSIIDLLFCCGGKQASLLLKSSKAI